MGFTASANQSVEFDLCNLLTTTHDQYHANDSHDIDPTDITSSSIHSCTVVDVGVYDASYAQSGPGFYECHSFNPSFTVCQVGHVHMDTDDPGIPENAGFTLKVMCQEVGHSVGLDHPTSPPNPTCMDGSSQHLSTHDHNLIDSNY